MSCRVYYWNLSPRIFIRIFSDRRIFSLLKIDHNKMINCNSHFQGLRSVDMHCSAGSNNLLHMTV